MKGILPVNCWTIWDSASLGITLEKLANKTQIASNNNNNNNRICIAQVCRMTSEALDGQLQSCYTARARPKCLTEEKCF